MSTDASLGRRVRLADGSWQDLSGMNRDELVRLQFEQERSYARRFVESPKHSRERATAFREGYDTITAIFATAHITAGEPVLMGFNGRNIALVRRLLRRQQRSGMAARLFEIGYGCGALLAAVADEGFPIGGIEVSPAMRTEAVGRIAPRHHDALRLGSFLDLDAPSYEMRPTIVYWNDVFEHVPPDEIADYLAKIHELLAPGGLLVTITPNWHMRPMDITGDFFPPRTTAQGVHLKEYTLREVTSLLRRAGFADVATPLFVTPGRVALAGRGMAGIKRFIEPALEWLPFRLAKLLVRGFGLSCTIAQKR
jgi:2-polyprenyl-3-methyl-5-hydroxy-6-metoxy-1,4-benzoquinol methylase